MNLTAIDWSIIAIYFVFLFVTAWYFARRQKTASQYFLAGRNSKWYAIGTSIFAANISSEHLIGLAGSGAAAGLAAVIFADMIQTIILIAGSLLLTIIGLNRVGGFMELKESLPPDFFDMLRPASDPNYPWPGIVFGISESPDLAYPMLLTNLLPAGLAGLVIAALMAALISSLSAVFNSSSSLFTMDVYRKFKPDANDRKLVMVGRIFTGIIVIIGVLWIPLIRHMNNQIYQIYSRFRHTSVHRLPLFF